VEGRKVVIAAVILGILAASYILYQLPREKEVLSMDAILRDIMENPSDRRLWVEPGTVEIQTAELMDFEQLPENERRFIGQWDVSNREYVSGGHEKVWVIEYKCWGSEGGPAIFSENYYAGWMLVRRVLDAYTGEGLLRFVKSRFDQVS